MEKWGYGLNRKEVLEAVGQYVTANKLETLFKDNVPGEDWFLNFKKRHNLFIKKPQAVQNARFKSTDPFLMHNYFELLLSVFHQHEFLADHPELIFNLDETSMSKDPSKMNVVGATGEPSRRRTATSGCTNLTVLFCVSADGGKLPPHIIFKGKNVWDFLDSRR